MNLSPRSGKGLAMLILIFFYRSVQTLEKKGRITIKQASSGVFRLLLKESYAVLI